MDNELYTNIIDANIEKSLYTATEILLKDSEKHYSIIDNTLISVCSYIGSFVSLREIKLWLEIVECSASSLESDKVQIKNLYSIITKMCVVCDMYKSNPTSKVGILPIKTLRSKVIDLFDDENCSLTSSGITKFKDILPPFDSPTFKLSLRIVSGYVRTKQFIETKSAYEDADELSDIANMLRNSFDYIVRKKFQFQTIFNPSDTDTVWFIWGIISILFQDENIDQIYYLFSHSYKKKIKQQRIGLLWAAALVMVYVMKKDVARNWNRKENMIISKIEDLHMELYKDIKQGFLSQSNDQNLHHSGKICDKRGIDYILSYRPTVHQEHEHTCQNNESFAETKQIKFRSK